MKVIGTGVAEAERAFARVQPVVQRRLVGVSRGGAEIAARVAATAAPRRTGRLAAAIGVTGDELTWTAGVDRSVSYAVPVEYGTVYTPAHPFMRVGATAAEVEVQRDVAKLAADLPELVR